MSQDQSSCIFNAYYYAHDCGRPYERDEFWLAAFDRIAEQIIATINPGTVLDAGCAWGFLVEALRNRGVEAWGIDISPYAIDQVHESIKPYCRVGSLTDPLEREYDLIVNIEVLEHMPSEDARLAVKNMSQFTDDILFSSTPFDYKEATHINVQPPEYWAGLFAQHGFYRDVDYDGSFITVWAVRFRKQSVAIPELIHQYERRFFYLWKENADVRQRLLEMQMEMQNEVAAQKSRADLAEQARQTYEKQLLEITNSRPWRFISFLQRIRLKLAPPGSWREKVFHRLLGKKPGADAVEDADAQDKT